MLENRFHPSQDASYVCDVNGWSLVKGSVKFCSDAAAVMLRLIVQLCHATVSAENILEVPSSTCSTVPQTASDKPELRCVFALMRHGDAHMAICGQAIYSYDTGDRTPKQKMKMDVSDERLLRLFGKYAGKKPKFVNMPSQFRFSQFMTCRAEIKLKTKLELGDVVASVREIMADDSVKAGIKEKLQIVIDVCSKRTFD